MDIHMYKHAHTYISKIVSVFLFAALTVSVLNCNVLVTYSNLSTREQSVLYTHHTEDDNKLGF